ncbi:hypothetical protein [Marinobacter nauticus]|nr:hypothetical protein [Marinobacter nauticus]
MPKKPNEDLRRYWGIFRDDRFAPADLWHWFRGAYYHSGGQDSWPRDDFLQWLALDTKSWIEPALGPRGGQGWRIAADAVEVCRAEEAFIEHTREEALAAISGVSVRIGRLYVEQRLAHPRFWEIVWCFEPPVPIKGPNVDGAGRHHTDTPFSFRALSTVGHSDLQERVICAEAHVSGLVAEAIGHHQNCIHQLNGLLNHVKP